MRLTRLLLACFFVSLAVPAAYAQKEISETHELSEEGRKAITDSLYFEALKASLKNDKQLSYRLFLKYVSLRPEVSDAWFELAKLAYDDKNLAKASEFVRKAVALYPDNKWYEEQYAAILADSGAFLHAAGILEALGMDSPDDPTYMQMAAENFERAGEPDSALRCLDYAIDKKGEDEDLVMQKVHIYLSMNNLDKATELVRKLTLEDPGNGRYYRMLGDLYDNNKVPAKATEVYEQAEKIIPHDPNVERGRAEHYLKLGDTANYILWVKKAMMNSNLDAESQVEMLTDFVQTMPNDSVTRVEGMPVISKMVQQHSADYQVWALYGDFLSPPDSAAWAYNRSLQLKSSVEVWRKLMDNYIRRQMPDSVIRYADKFIRLYPNQVEPYFFSAQGHFLKKDYQGAIRAINHAIDNQPENNKKAMSELYGFMAQIYHGNRQDDFSDKAFDKALEYDPENAGLLNDYGYFLSERGVRLEDAERMSRKSIDLKPGEPAFLDTYGWIKYRMGEYGKAKQFVKRAIDLAGDNADGALLDHLGDICYKLNEKDQAVEYWKMAKKKGVDNPRIDKKISEGKLYE